MKRLLTAATLVLAAALAGAPGSLLAGTTDTYTLRITGGDGPNDISIGLNGASDEYVIRANGTIPPIETCTNPPGTTRELRCPQADISGFEIRSRGGNDTITLRKSVPVTSILNGGEDLDDLAGGRNSDRLTGGPGGDKLVGRGGADFIFGGPGEDLLLGGPGKDLLRGGPGADELRGGPGRDVETQ